MQRRSGCPFKPQASAILCFVTSGKSKKDDRKIFDSIRKPTAPPSRTFGEEKPDERAHPSGRKVKHKKKTDPKNLDGDL